MITVDATVQLILAISVSFSIVIVSYNLARLIGAAVVLVQELRRPLQNVSEVTDLAVEDYKSIRGIVTMFSGASTGFKAIKSLASVVKNFSGADDKDENPE